MIGKRLLFLSILLLFTLNILAAFNLYMTTVSAVEYPAIYIEPATTVDLTLTPGNLYTISVKTNYTGDDIQGWQFTLSYDPDVLNGTKVTNGDLIVGGTAMFVPGTFNNTAGKLSLTGAFFFFFVEPAPVTSGPGTLANVTFTVVDYGASDIALGPETKLKGYTDVRWGYDEFGQWKYGGWGDPYNIIHAETMPSHIQHGTFINVQPIHDVAVGLVAPAEAVVGQLVSINVTVVNKGTYRENVTLTVSYDDTPINTTTFTLTLLKGGLNETFSFKWNTAGLTPGNYVIEAAATIAQDDKPANNKVTKPIALKLAHDVAVTSLVAPEEAVVGQLVSINVTVANQGSYDETVTVSVYNENTVIDTQIFSLIIGESTTRLFSWDTSIGVAGGNYTINATATITEDNEPANNVQTKPIVLTFVRDVAVIDITHTPDTPSVGQHVTINVTIKNHGSYSEDFEVWFTCNVTIKRKEVTVYTTERESVTPPLGDSTNLTFNWNTTGITPGGHRIVAEAILPQDANATNNRATSDYFSVISSLGSILGYVRDSFTEHAIVGANVTVDTVASATTGEGGKYSIENIPAGTYNVTASAHGYKSSSENITVTAGETILNFNLTPIVGTITGTVTDSLTGEPIPRANVTASGYSATTEADGNYTIANMPAGTYNVTASADGYKSSTRSNVNVTPGETTILNFTLTPIPTTGTIAGVVKHSSTGDPIADAIVTANNMSATTNSSGAYTISNVPPGNYTVTASADGYESLTETNIPVIAGETTQVDFELTPVQPLNILIYAGAAAIAIIVVVATAIYIIKVRKPKPA